jgi:hypothetical protein
LAGLGLIACGILFAVLLVYLPLSNGPDGFMGPVRLNALVFIPLALVTGVGYWQLQTRGLRVPEPVILETYAGVAVLP